MTGGSTQPSLPRQFADVAKEADWFWTNPDIFRHGLKGALARDRYFAKAAALGVDRNLAAGYLAEAERELAESFWWVRRRC